MSVSVSESVINEGFARPMFRNSLLSHGMASERGFKREEKASKIVNNKKRERRNENRQARQPNSLNRE